MPLVDLERLGPLFDLERLGPLIGSPPSGAASRPDIPYRCFLGRPVASRQPRPSPDQFARPLTGCWRDGYRFAKSEGESIFTNPETP